jgi:hypothetical protein
VFLAAAWDSGLMPKLALNGYGKDAMRIARGMYEIAVNAAYLAKHPTEIDDFFDYQWVQQKKRYEYLQKYDPQTASRLTQQQLSQMTTELAKVASRFQDPKTKRWRTSWCSKSVRERADDVRPNTGPAGLPILLLGASA